MNLWRPALLEQVAYLLTFEIFYRFDVILQKPSPLLMARTSPALGTSSSLSEENDSELTEEARKVRSAN